MVRGFQHRLSFSQNSHLTSGSLLLHYPHSLVPQRGSSPAHGAIGRAAGREVTGELDSSDGATWGFCTLQTLLSDHVVISTSSALLPSLYVGECWRFCPQPLCGSCAGLGHFPAGWSLGEVFASFSDWPSDSWWGSSRWDRASPPTFLLPTQYKLLWYFLIAEFMEIHRKRFPARNWLTEMWGQVGQP